MVIAYIIFIKRWICLINVKVKLKNLNNKKKLRVSATRYEYHNLHVTSCKHYLLVDADMSCMLKFNRCDTQLIFIHQCWQPSFPTATGTLQNLICNNSACLSRVYIQPVQY